MIGVVIIAIKIVLKNGKDMSRELLGVKFQPIRGILSISTVAVAPATPKDKAPMALVAHKTPITTKTSRTQLNSDVTEFLELSDVN